MKMQKKSLAGLIPMLFILTLALTLVVSQGHAAIPQQINYQGYLTNASGVPINGTVNMTFRIYDISSGGSSLWIETQNNVPVTHGVYNVILGSQAPIGLSFDAPYFLEIEIGGEVLSPRKAITSVGYAFRALTVESVGSHTHSGADITTGTVADARIDSLIARDSEVTSAVNAHATRIDNPHSTTAAQVGAAPSLHNHSGGDITTGTVDEARIDPLVARDSEVSAAIALHNHDDRYYDKAYVNALEARIAALEAKLSGLTRSGDDFIITNANLYIQSGSGWTNGAVNGKGNLIIGYNELRGLFDDRNGSHNLILGDLNNYSSYGGIVAGVFNTISGAYSSVTGGYSNTAGGYASSVSGGESNIASGNYSSISGGLYNTASGLFSSVSGGESNFAREYASSISGGGNNSADAYASSVSGGNYNTASGSYSLVSGGEYNNASGYFSSVSAGSHNTSHSYASSVSGGGNNTAFGSYSSVSGGENNLASSFYSSVSGGSNNTASGGGSSVSGGYNRNATGPDDWVAGALWEDQ